MYQNLYEVVVDLEVLCEASWIQLDLTRSWVDIRHNIYPSAPFR